jgi:imidazolonepropionase-like amidohydrolase
MTTSPYCAFAVLLLAAGTAGAQSRGPLAPGAYAIVNVNVVPMTSAAVVPNATILIENGRIKAVGPDVRVPGGTRTIDGRGAFVIPGLADMHTHLYSDGEVPDSAAPAELGVMLANGVTATRMMGGTPEQLHLRDQVRRGEVLGPQLWVSGPMIANRPDDNVRLVTSPDSARTAVRDIAAAGYDFIKITFGITGATYDALTDEARARRIRVVGHVEPALGLTRAIEAGQQIEHLDAFFEAVLADSSPIKESLTQGGAYRVKNWESLDYIDDRKVTALAARVAESRVWVGPTLESFNRWFGTPYTDDELHALPDWQIIPNGMRTLYTNARARHLAQPISAERRARYANLRNSIVKQITDAGGADRLLAGSDTPDFLMTYGFALHRELQGLVRAGLTPYQALATATRNPAEFLGATAEWGTIERGKRADLVMVTGDPLADIRNTQRIERVIIGGKLLERSELEAMIRRGAAAVTGTPRR